MKLTIADEIFAQTGLSQSDILIEMAIALYLREVLPLRKAAHLAQKTPKAFRETLAERQISEHYSMSDLMRDLSR